jgi:hypothetical protein
MRTLARYLQAVRDRSSDSPPRLDLPAVTRAHSWTFRCKPLMSNARILAQLEKFARDINLRPCLLISGSVRIRSRNNLGNLPFNTSDKCYTVRSSLKARHSPPRPRAGGSSSSDLKTTTGRDTNRAVGTGRSVEKATGRAAPRALFLKGTFGFEMHLMV